MLLARKYHSEALIQDLLDHIDEVFERDSDVRYTTIHLGSTCGSGKSTALVGLLEHVVKRCPTAKMLCHTSRCALASNLFKLLKTSNVLKFHPYKDSNDYSQLVLQVESTMKLIEGNKAVAYDVLVVDELMAHMAQLVAGLCGKDKYKVLMYFLELVKSVKVLITFVPTQP